MESTRGFHSITQPATEKRGIPVALSQNVWLSFVFSCMTASTITYAALAL